MLALLGHLSASLNLRIALLLNEDEGRLQYVIENSGVKEVASLVISSCSVGYVKPEPELYHVALQLLDRVNEPSAVIYVDDRQTHVDAATKEGMQGHKYSDPGTFTRYLEELGVLN
jgi:putative hydrolase of the HAD superfamily